MSISNTCSMLPRSTPPISTPPRSTPPRSMLPSQGTPLGSLHRSSTSVTVTPPSVYYGVELSLHMEQAFPIYGAFKQDIKGLSQRPWIKHFREHNFTDWQVTL